ncbi:hypothetical protein ACLOJK_000790 [Asimina triloba]
MRASIRLGSESNSKDITSLSIYHLSMTKKLSLNQSNLGSKFVMIQEIGKGIGLEIIIPEYADEEDTTFEIFEDLSTNLRHPSHIGHRLNYCPSGTI